MEEEMEKWWFVVYFAGVATCFVVAVALERRDREDRVLQRRWYVLLAQALLSLVLWYVAYIAALFTLDLLVQERFSLMQAFDAREFVLHTRRGVVCICAYLLGAALFAPVLNVALEPRGEGPVVFDLCFTSSVLHFVVVVAIRRRFPLVGGWWLAHLVGALLLIVCSLGLNHRLNILSIPSTRAIIEKQSGSSKAVEMAPL